MPNQGNKSYGEHAAELLRNKDYRDVIRLFEDFVTVPTDDTTSKQTLFDETADAGATGVTGPADGKGGWLQIYCDGDDNDEAYLWSASEAYIFNTTDQVLFEARIKHTAGSTDGKSGWVIGLSDTVAANVLVDAGTLMTSFDGALFHKNEDGEISFTTSNATTQVNTAAIANWTDGDTVKLGFIYVPNKDGTTGTIIPLINGAQAVDSNGDPITHTITLSGLAEMHLLMGVKTFEGAEQALLVDWVETIQER